MAVKLVYFVLVVIGAFGLGNGLKCNLCLASKTSDCYNAKSSSYIVGDCSKMEPNQSKMARFFNSTIDSSKAMDTHCIKIAVKQSNYDDVVFFRDCIFTQGISDVCKELSAAATVEKCSTCKDKDLCNSAPGNNVFLGSMLSAILIIPYVLTVM